MKKDQLKKGQIKKYPPKKDPQPVKQVKKNRYSNLVGLAIIILLGIIIYSNSFDCSFHFDDNHTIVENPKIHNLSDVKAWWFYSPSRLTVIFTFALNYHFSQLNVRSYHLVNLAIHLINAILVWQLVLLILSSPAMKDHPIVRYKKILALFTALLFVSHPLATQSVTYIVQRFNSMAAMFYLLSLVLYAKARLTDKGMISKTMLFSGSLISAVLAMFTKENAFTLPFAILLFEFFFIRTKKLSINFRDYRVILLLAAFLCVIMIIPLKYSLSIFNPIPPTQGQTHTLTPFNYLLTQFSVITKYIQLLFLPVNLHLDYEFPVSDNFFGIRTFLSFLFLLFLIILAIFLFNRNRIISFGIFWFFLTLLIESSLIPINDVIVEHRTYLPSFGFFLILCPGLYISLPEKFKVNAIAILAIIIVSYSFMTYERNKIWKDDLSLWNDNVEKAPGFARPLSNRGVAYRVLGKYDLAIADFSSAIEINPDFRDPYSQRGLVYGMINDLERSVSDYSRAIEINPKIARGYYDRGVSYGMLGQRDKAIADYSSAIRINPHDKQPFINRGAEYGNMGQWDRASDDYSNAIGIDPRYALAYYNRGIAYGNLGQWEKAIADYTIMIGLDPNNAQGYFNRAVAYWNQGNYKMAIDDNSAVIQLNPKSKDAYVNRGNAYGKLKQWDKAIADYNSALAIDPNFPVAYSNREIVYRNLKSIKSK